MQLPGFSLRVGLQEIALTLTVGNFFEGDIVIDLPSSPGHVSQDERANERYRREARAEDPTNEAATISPTQASEGYKNRTDLWEGGKVLFRYEEDMSKFLCAQLHQGVATVLSMLENCRWGYSIIQSAPHTSVR